MDSRTCAMINGVNSRLVSHITGRSAHEEASKRTRIFDLLSQKVVMIGSHFTYGPNTTGTQGITVHYLFDNRSEGDLIMDVLPKWTWDELKELVQNRAGWRQRVRAVKSDAGVTVGITSSGTPAKAATASSRDTKLSQTRSPSVSTQNREKEDRGKEI